MPPGLSVGRRNLSSDYIMMGRGPQILTRDTRPIHGQNCLIQTLVDGLREGHAIEVSSSTMCARRTLSVIATWDLDLSKL
jgi:hypothetical protein